MSQPPADRGAGPLCEEIPTSGRQRRYSSVLCFSKHNTRSEPHPYPYPETLTRVLVEVRVFRMGKRLPRSRQLRGSRTRPRARHWRPRRPRPATWKISRMKRCRLLRECRRRPKQRMVLTPASSLRRYSRKRSKHLCLCQAVLMGCRKAICRPSQLSVRRCRR